MHPVAGKQKSIAICRAFAEGAPKGADCYVFYGVTESNVAAWIDAKKSGTDWYYIDNSYFDSVRGQQYRVTKNRVQVDPLGRSSDGERFKKLGLTVQPMNARASDLWVLIEQSPSFMQYVAGDPHWLESMAGGIPKGHRIVVRRWVADKIKQQETLPEAIEGAWTVVAHSSAAAVSAAVLGVPAAVSPMSAIYGMRYSTHSEHDQRQHYLNVLADNQWTLDEIKAGRAWAWLAGKT